MNKFTLTNKFVSDTLCLNVSLANKEGEIEIYAVDCDGAKTLAFRIIYDDEGVDCKHMDANCYVLNKDLKKFVSKVGAKHAVWKAAGLEGSKTCLSLQDRVVARFFKN
jgi:hypothetical protein